ncbi:hypothetical protein CERSUDRAFT_120161 [Gelatoporia subvermispora B]|uniref:Uncharacterized protein n=1 Tax=Ceriporiopsis subvermispora (strain B) TaxID=914234 RepID=M2QYP5_CERS8|nr:hypothetical protein CERSUDRAFT_120161 [Gelatoporia subvermispora B]
MRRDRLCGSRVASTVQARRWDDNGVHMWVARRHAERGARRALGVLTLAGLWRDPEVCDLKSEEWCSTGHRDVPRSSRPAQTRGPGTRRRIARHLRLRAAGWRAR